MKKMESQLGQWVHCFETLEDMTATMSQDAGRFLSKIEKLMRKIDMRNPYDREIAMMVATNLAASVICAIEVNFDHEAESMAKWWYDFYKEEYLKLVNQKFQIEPEPEKEQQEVKTTGQLFLESEGIV